MTITRAAFLVASLFLAVGCAAKAVPTPDVASPGAAVAAASTPAPVLADGDGISPRTPLVLQPGVPRSDLMPCGQPFYFRPDTKPGAPFELAFAIQTPDVPQACVHLSFTTLDDASPTAPVSQCTGKKAPEWDEIKVAYDGALGAPLIRLTADSTCQGVFYRLTVR